MIVSYTAVFVPSPKLTLLRDKEGFVGDEGDHEDARDFHFTLGNFDLKFGQLFAAARRIGSM